MRNQSKAVVPAREFIELIKQHGLHRTAKILGVSDRSVFKRRKNLEAMMHVPIAGPDNKSHRQPEYPWRAELTVKDGIVLICGDAHYWPGSASLMHRAFVAFCKEYRKQLKAVVHIGDVIDAPSISRHARIGWEERPPLCDEIEATKERLYEIEQAAGRVERTWCLGNHDARFETRLANVAPEYASIHGVHLHDHFPLWRTAWSCWINDGELVAKHRYKSGIYAPRNNTLNSGKSMATGHLHSAKVMPLTDFNGTRYGVDVGCIADTDHKAFVDYSEDNAKDWRSAFGVFTFRNGKLMYPELVLRWDKDHVQFRGSVFAP